MIGFIRKLGIRSSLRAARDTIRGGGPAGLRLLEVHPPEGYLVPIVVLDLEVSMRDGGATELSPGFPLPSPLAWGWRVGKFGAMIRDRIAR